MQLFNNMIAFDFTQRPSISEIRQSNWMKEINWELLPFLKQEFMFREENIKINEFKSSIINEKEHLNKTNEPNKSKINISINNISKSFKNVDIVENKIKEEEQKNNINKSERNIKIKSTKRNLSKHVNNIHRFLKKEGFKKFETKLKRNELAVTNGEIDILFKLEKYESKYIILSYYQKNGTFRSFEKFKNLLVNIKQIIEKSE